MSIGRRSLFTVVLLAAAAALAALAIAHGSAFWRHQVKQLTEYGEPRHIALGEMKLDPSWVLSGSPTFRVNAFAKSKDGSSVSGIWECRGPGTFVWEYGIDETIYILEGSAQIKYLGKTITLGPGDSLRFAAGTKATWTVPHYVKKTFRLDDAGRIVPFLRRKFAGES